ncbi:MAG: hypothetical protein OXU27_17035 [Candidatus Poribacteria bacterium]|nr:hypothetical protein [Candidatus Poribacteria bacterium]MDE0323292.1 hypothetical protein [Candidatus Poribacteria bacterium]
MFLRKNWLPLSVFLLAIVGVGLYYLQTRPPKDPIIIYKAVDVETKPKPPPPGETFETGHWHGDEWHANDAHAPVEVATPEAQGTPVDAQIEQPVNAQIDAPMPEGSDTSTPYQILREKYPDQTQNPHPFENVPVDLWDFEATKTAFMDHFNFYVSQRGNEPEVFESNREVRIAAAVMANIYNASKPWVGLFTPEQREEIKEMRRSYREFNGVKVNHDRVWELVHDEGYSVSEALRVSREEGSNR